MGVGSSRQAEPRHHSLNCRTPTVVEFVNDTPHNVQTVWVGYDGSQRCYYALRPGGRVRQPTFTAHPWLFMCPEEPGVQCVVGDQAVFYAPPPAGENAPAYEAHITTVSGVPWCPASHAAFPPAFRSQAATLLFCHRRLAMQRASGGCREAEVALQCSWLRRLRRQLSVQAGVAAGQQGEPPAAAAARGLEQRCGLGDLPKDLLLEVLAAAAPYVPLLVKPRLPHSVESDELSAEALQLFRQEGSDSAEQAAAAPPAGPAPGVL